ncbi:Gfo/Idh/MocA family oxidoreductase [Actinomyces sp. MRS3W]|uniref:Gfo/Idh/MocA family oxidoreductase n=1 Tax=Actinomyces sp. MRS3W TaxID=2800796 RepID=UPI0028FD7D8A|nr:Gfo/Idh/MocA family oxidoreductase [Actinomyces sp. MRS3W]MDU0349134.1 Gfo/Idh/MocA family oxidoreductase [Actinomyces sp. MRS3W]
MQTFALLGAGFIGRVHAENLAAQPHIRFARIFDVDPARAGELAALHGAEPAAEADEVFADPDIDAVLIASSTNTHADLLKRAAAAGKAVFCEKPIDLSLEVARDAAAAVRAAGIPVMMDFNRRYDAAYAAVHDAVQAGEVGQVELVSMTTRGPSLPPIDYLKVSGGQMRDQTVHFFDLLRWITGLEPVEVYVAGAAMVDPAVAEVGDVDTSVAVLRLANGAIVQIDSQRRIGYGYDERIEVNGSVRMVEAARHRTGFVNHYGPGELRTNGLDVGWFERIRGTYRKSLDAFVDALEHDSRVPAPLEDGLRAQIIAEAATESLHTHRPVAIPEGL